MKKLLFVANEQLQKLTKGNLSKVVGTDGEWAEKITEKDLAKLGALIIQNDLDDVVQAEFDEEDYEVDFSFNKVAKSIFITHLSNIWERENGIGYAIKALSEIERFETKFKKSAIMFKEEEIKEAIEGIGDRTNFYGLKFKIKIYKDYYNFFAKDLGLKAKDNLWALYQNAKKLATVIGTKEGDRLLKREDLIDLFNTMMNPQQGIVPLLIFEGLSISRKYEVDDIRTLKRENVFSHKLKLEALTDEVDGRGYRVSVDREIEIDPEVMVCIAKASASENIVRANKHELEILKLKDTPFVLRGAIGRKMSSSGDILSYGGVYDRLLECQRQFESLNVEIDDFSAGYIANCGKSFYIDKFMSEGNSETEAIIKTLKRFGEWNTIGDHKQDVKLDTNKIRIARLRRSYPLYLEK
ncbi:hypothetical protein [Enterococcus mundtii]|uniref:hypothetical protein n=1 Tax=Enterococcus mundtii TaxID=53346 RepID=UPI001A978EC7|nr:hypothetical protein [Enterococcus mundtii]MBO1087165.1 hypothetical protein [Enterococcus mundtii]